MPTYQFAYPSVSASEEKMLDDVQQVLRQNKTDEALQDGFLLVVSEAFTNALVHGNGSDPDKIVKLTIDINQNALVADIVDEGQGGLNRVKQHRPPDILSEGGRGLELIEHFATDVTFSETERGGLRVCIRFDLTETKKVQRLL